jgi:hypothetical protein
MNYVKSNIQYYSLITWEAWLWWLYSMLSCESQDTVSAHEVNLHIQCSCFLTQDMYIAIQANVFGTPRKNWFRDL